MQDDEKELQGWCADVTDNVSGSELRRKEMKVLWEAELPMTCSTLTQGWQMRTRQHKAAPLRLCLKLSPTFFPPPPSNFLFPMVD